MCEVLSSVSNLTTVVGVVAGPFAPVVGAVGMAFFGVKLLSQKYQAMCVKSFTGLKVLLIFSCDKPVVRSVSRGIHRGSHPNSAQPLHCHTSKGTA